MEKTYRYEICIEGHLSDHWSEWFEGLEIYDEPNHGTMLSGIFIDQAALFGILNKIQSLNLALISVKRLPNEPASG